MKFTMDLEKANPVVESDGSLTRRGIEIATRYAHEWVRGRRNLSLEREHPALEDAFFDIRVDPIAAKDWTQIPPNKFVVPTE